MTGRPGPRCLCVPPATGSDPPAADPLLPDAVWPRPGGPAGVPDAETDPGTDGTDGAIEAVLTVPGTPPGGDGTMAPALTASGEQLLAPLEGDVLAAFGFQVSTAHGDYRFHTGVDVAAPLGAEVGERFPAW